MITVHGFIKVNHENRVHSLSMPVVWLNNQERKMAMWHTACLKKWTSRMSI
jgi:hypothetical protein